VSDDKRDMSLVRDSHFITDHEWPNSSQIWEEYVHETSRKTQRLAACQSVPYATNIFVPDHLMPTY